MPVVRIHEETFESVRDNQILAALVATCVEHRKNPDILCALIMVLIKRQAFGTCFDSRTITNIDSMEFFKKQFDRATIAIAA